MEIEKTTQMGMLYDYYGELLTEKQRRLFEMYYEENLSLGEIGEEIEVSRQAVHDSIKKTEVLLEGYEEKLSVLADRNRRAELVEKIFRELRGDNNRIKIEAYLRGIGD